jgi:hypothetical protein
MRDIATKVTGNNLTADEFNDIPTELENAITSAGITLSGADLSQLPKAIAHYVGNASFYTDTGVADAYVGTAIGTNHSPPAYVDGMDVEFKVGNTNTGASTINVDGLGVKNITGSATAGTLITGDFVRLRYNIGSGEFDIVQATAITLSDFTGGNQSLIGNGFQKIPGGLIIQWGTVTVVAHQVLETFSFPLAFPTAAFITMATINRTTSVTGTIGIFSNVLSATQFQLMVDADTTTPTNSPVYWYAVGH